VLTWTVKAVATIAAEIIEAHFIFSAFGMFNSTVFPSSHRRETGASRRQ